MLFKNNPNLVTKLFSYVDCLGISVDSFDSIINQKIGRKTINNTTIDFETISLVSDISKQKNKKIKVNIVVNKMNLYDESIYKLNDLKIDKIKLFKNQNHVLGITDEEFNNYTYRFLEKIKIPNCQIVIENEMNNAYLMLDHLQKKYQLIITNL